MRPTTFEFYYSTGGHGGPHSGSLTEVKLIAIRLLAGNINERHIRIVSRKSGECAAIVTRTHLDYIDRISA